MLEKVTFTSPMVYQRRSDEEGFIPRDVQLWGDGKGYQLRSFPEDHWDMEVTFTKKAPPAPKFKVGEYATRIAGPFRGSIGRVAEVYVDSGADLVRLEGFVHPTGSKIVVGGGTWPASELEHAEKPFVPGFFRYDYSDGSSMVAWFTTGDRSGHGWRRVIVTDAEDDE